MNATLLTILAQTPAPAAPQQNLFEALVPFVVIAIVFYFLIIRPQQKRAKEHNTLISSIKTGDAVVTNSGIHGIISNAKDKTFMLKIADNVKIEVEKSAIARVDRPTEQG